MNIDPLIIVHDTKVVSLQKALSTVEKFTSTACNDNPASILSKQLRLSRPSDDVSEKLKSLVASIHEEMGAYTSAMKDVKEYHSDNITKSNKKRKLHTTANSSEANLKYPEEVKVEKKSKVDKKSKSKK